MLFPPVIVSILPLHGMIALVLIIGSGGDWFSLLGVIFVMVVVCYRSLWLSWLSIRLLRSGWPPMVMYGMVHCYWIITEWSWWIWKPCRGMHVVCVLFIVNWIVGLMGQKLTLSDIITNFWVALLSSCTSSMLFFILGHILNVCPATSPCTRKNIPSGT